MVPKVPPCLVIDSKGFYDAVTRSCCSEALSVERRLQIDYAIAKETVKNQNVLVFWVNNLRMCADGRTKLKGIQSLYSKSWRRDFSEQCAHSPEGKRKHPPQPRVCDNVSLCTDFSKGRNSNAILARTISVCSQASFTCLSMGCTDGSKPWNLCWDIQSCLSKITGISWANKDGMYRS